MSIPQAVASSIVTPGLYLTVNLLAGASSPGQDPFKVLLLAPRSSSGDLTADTEIRAGSGEESAATAFGPGTPGHLAAKQIYTQYPQALVYFGTSGVPGGSAPTLNVTASGVPTSAQSVHFDVMGREWDVEWNASETADTFKTRAINSILQRTQDLAVTASSGGVGIITITGKHPGTMLNDVLVKVTLNEAQTGTEALAGAASYTNLAGGTTEPDYTTILTVAAGTEFAYILPVMSNTDAELTTSSSNAARVLSHIETYNTGLNASLQQCFTAATDSQSAAKAAAIALNSPLVEYVYALNARSLPCEIAARELAGRLAAESLDPAANRIGEELDGIYGSANVAADRPTASEAEDALTNGLAIVGYNASGRPVILRPITTYSLDESGGPDRRLLDVQNVSGTYAVARDLRSALPQEFPNAKITPDTVEGEDPPPAGVTEERDIKAFIISRLRFWQREGVVQKAALDEVIANGELIVQVNESDSTQVDIVIPIKIVQPLAKMGVVVQRRPG